MSAFVYYNNNPFGHTEPDCVTRAMSLALNKDYRYIRRELYRNAKKNGCDRLTKICYRQILEDKFGLQQRYGQDQTVGHIADLYPYHNVIMRVTGHLTCSSKGTIYDLFDCRDEIVDEYWVITT